MIKDENNVKINKTQVELLDCQIELILQSLELYSHVLKFMGQKEVTSNSSENSNFLFVRDTYHQIIDEYVNIPKMNYKYDKDNINNVVA